MFEEGKKAKYICQQLDDEGIEILSRIKLNNVLTILKTAKFGNSSMSLGELETWLKSIATIPDDQDIPYELFFFLNKN